MKLPIFNPKSRRINRRSDAQKMPHNLDAAGPVGSDETSAAQSRPLHSSTPTLAAHVEGNGPHRRGRRPHRARRPHRDAARRPAADEPAIEVSSNVKSVDYRYNRVCGHRPHGGMGLDGAGCQTTSAAGLGSCGLYLRTTRRAEVCRGTRKLPCVISTRKRRARACPRRGPGGGGRGAGVVRAVHGAVSSLTILCV